MIQRPQDNRSQRYNESLPHHSSTTEYRFVMLSHRRNIFQNIKTDRRSFAVAQDDRTGQTTSGPFPAHSRRNSRFKLASGKGPYNVSAAQNTKGNKTRSTLLWVSPPRYLWPNKRCNVGIAPYNVSTAQNIKRNKTLATVLWI